jgi:hypothetical protein
VLEVLEDVLGVDGYDHRVGMRKRKEKRTNRNSEKKLNK